MYLGRGYHFGIYITFSDKFFSYCPVVACHPVLDD